MTALNEIRKLELKRDHKYIVFIPLNSGLKREEIEQINVDHLNLNYKDILFVSVKDSKDIKVIEQKK